MRLINIGANPADALFDEDRGSPANGRNTRELHRLGR